MARQKPQQRLISFVDNPQEMDRIRSELNEGWFFISLVANNGYYVGILEKTNSKNPESIYIPPRKKVKLAL